MVGSLSLNLGIANLSAQDVVIDRMVAVVNGDIVTLSDVRAARRLMLVPLAASGDDRGDDGVVGLLIERRLMLAEVARYAPVEPTTEQIAAKRATWTGALPAGTDVASTLASVGMSEAMLVAWFRNDLRLAGYLDQRFTAAAQPTREQALTYFREHEQDFAVAGATLEFATIEAAVRRRVAADRRAARIREWIESLKARAEIRRIGTEGQASAWPSGGAEAPPYVLAPLGYGGPSFSLAAWRN